MFYLFAREKEKEQAQGEAADRGRTWLPAEQGA